MSFLKNLWNGIKKLFQGLRIKSKVWVHLAVEIVQKMKEVTDSPVADFITDLIPSQLDNHVKDKLREFIPRLLLQLNMVDAIANIEDPNEQVQAILQRIKFSSKDVRDIFWHGFASKLLEVISDGKFDWKDAVAVSQYYYDHILDTDEQVKPEEIAPALASEDDGDDE